VVGLDPSGTLTPRQKTVLSMLGDGLGPKEIAARLGISVWTVRAHRHLG